MNISNTVKSWLLRSVVAVAFVVGALIPRSALATDTDLYIMQGGDLYRVNEWTGVRTHVGVDGEWFLPTSMATEDPYPGTEDHEVAYTIWADTLWYIDLGLDDEGDAFWMGDAVWTGPTHMVHGHTGGLIIWQGGYLYTVNTSTNARRKLGTKRWTDASAMTYLDYNNNTAGNDLFLVQANSLWRVNVFNGRYVRLSDGWSNTTAMTADWSDLYIVSENHLYKVSPSTGSRTDLGGGWNSTSSLYHFDGDDRLYAIANAALYKVDTTTGSKTALGNDFWFGWTAMSSRVIGR